jgi:hypothetical protein
MRKRISKNNGLLDGDNDADLFPTTLKSLVVLSPGRWCRPSYLNDFVKANGVDVVEQPWDQADRIDALVQWENAWADGINGGNGFWDLTGRYVVENRR